MSDTSVPLIVLTTRQDDAELINRTLRDAGHPVRCRWISRPDALAETLETASCELLLLFADHFPCHVREVARIRQHSALMVPLIVVGDSADESAIAEAMGAGAQDLVSVAHKERLCAVAERELRAFRLERALNETLNSATQYKKQLKAFLAGSVDAIAHVQEGIIVEANQAWADLFLQPDLDAVQGPLMDHFDGSNQAALKGALMACAKGQWDGEPLKVTALTGDGSTLQLKLNLEATEFEGEPAIKLWVQHQSETREEPEQLVERAVHTDPVTGFYHRRRFIELLTDRLDAPSRGGVRALAFIRPDKFGEIEEDVGPFASEEIILQLAELLQGMAHDNDILGRFGGTVFTLLLERGTLRDIEAWAEHIVTRISDHIFEVAKNTLALTCTIGLVEISPGSDRVERLIADAERANQRGRQRGGNQVVLEETSDESTRVQRFDALWLHQIKAALVDNRFKLAHLPIANLSGKPARMYDTVLRMLDQQGDDVAASEFMGAATRNALLRPIDRWVIGATIQFCAKQAVDVVFVKLCHESILDATLVSWVQQQAAEHNVDPSRICFQVSEDDATQYLKQTNGVAEQFKAAGFRFAIEHFGIGRDPLRVLSQTTMNYVKFDGSLMQSIAMNPQLQEKIRNFVKAAEKRKIQTIAERVEDANTMAVLFQLGVSYMQGHYLHEPEVVLEG